MDIYEEIFNMLSAVLPVQKWRVVHDVVERVKRKQPRDWRLPILACTAVGGNAERAIPVAAAIGCMQVSIILIDDLLDKDPRGEYHTIGEAAAANLAIAFQAAGLECAAQSEADSNTILAVLGSLNQMMLKTALGQHLDIQNPENETDYWDLVRTKSSPFFGTALHIGALLGGAPPESAAGFKRFGHLYGEMIQIHDDLNDVMEVPANPDWVQGRSSLPILFAGTVDHPDKSRFLELQQSISNEDALSEAQTILIRCGAVSYSLDQLLARYQGAKQILAAIPLSHYEELAGMLADVIDPMIKLLAVIDVAAPAELLQSATPISKSLQTADEA